MIRARSKIYSVEGRWVTVDTQLRCTSTYSQPFPQTDSIILTGFPGCLAPPHLINGRTSSIVCLKIVN